MKYTFNILIGITMMFAISIISNNVEAATYFLGDYPNGSSAYLDVSSITIENNYRNKYHEGDTYRCIVNAYYEGTDEYDVNHYEIYIGQTANIIKNGEKVWQTIRAKNPKYLDENPVERNLLKYLAQKQQREWRYVPEVIE